MLIFDIEVTTVLNYVLLGVIVLGLILLFLNCFIYVAKDRVAIIERVGEYIGTFGPGMHFLGAYIYRRVGYYKTGETKLYLTIKREDYIVKFQIKNFYRYHYYGAHDAEGIVKASLSENPTDLSALLIKRFNDVGAKFISLEKVKRRR